MERSGDKCEECGTAIKIGDRVKFVQDTRREERGLPSFYIWHETCFDGAVPLITDWPEVKARVAQQQRRKIEAMAIPCAVCGNNVFTCGCAPAPDPIETARQKAQDAWVAAGKQTPCFDPAYMAAREELARAWERRYGGPPVGSRFPDSVDYMRAAREISGRT